MASSTGLRVRRRRRAYPRQRYKKCRRAKRRLHPNAISTAVTSGAAFSGGSQPTRHAISTHARVAAVFTSSTSVSPTSLRSSIPSW